MSHPTRPRSHQGERTREVHRLRVPCSRSGKSDALTCANVTGGSKSFIVFSAAVHTKSWPHGLLKAQLTATVPRVSHTVGAYPGRLCAIIAYPVADNNEADRLADLDLVAAVVDGELHDRTLAHQLGLGPAGELDRLERDS